MSLNCAKCGETGKYKCERCLESYCSSNCQVEDWPIHKNVCYKLPGLIPSNIVKSYASCENVRLNSSHRASSVVSNTSDGQKKSTISDRLRVVANDKAACASKDSAQQVTSPSDNVDDNKALKKIVTATESVLTEKISNWRIAFPPPDNLFDAIVQFIEETKGSETIVWVSDVKYNMALLKLLKEIKGNINLEFPCKPESIQIGALVAAPFLKVLYRAEIINICPESKKATVCLIDYGNVLVLSYAQLYPPIPIMLNLNAYSFRVRLPDESPALELESTIKIRVIGEKTPSGYYNVEYPAKAMCLQLPVQLLSKESQFTVVKYFADGCHTLLRVESSKYNAGNMNLHSILDASSKSADFDVIPNEGTFVAASTLRGWKRARLLGFYEKQHQFLVYTIDEGYMCMSPQIKRIPAAFSSLPLTVFALTCKDSYMLSEDMLLTTKKLSLQLLPSTSEKPRDLSSESLSLSCALFDEDRKIVDVVASVFTGLLSELNVKLWSEPITEGSSVYISHVVTYKEVFITSSNCKEYNSIFKAEVKKCSTYTKDEVIENGDIVFICSEDKDVFYRGEIISHNDNLFRVLNIDAGFQESVMRTHLRKPTAFIRSLPVQCDLVKLTILKTLPASIANNKALGKLEECMMKEIDFNVTWIESDTVDLTFRTNKAESLCKELIPMVFEPLESTNVAVVAESNKTTLEKTESTTSLPPSPPPTPKIKEAPVEVAVNAISQSTNEKISAQTTLNKMYTISDVNLVPIKCGPKVPLIVFDTNSLLNSPPFIVVADARNTEVLAHQEGNLAKVGAYCNGPSSPKTEYTPRKEELCLAIFEGDGDWYRAMCVEQLSTDIFEVLFFDYGNHAKVNKKNIKPIIPELMFPAIANIVYIDNLSGKDQVLAFKKTLDEKSVVCLKITKRNEEEYNGSIIE